MKKLIDYMKKNKISARHMSHIIDVSIPSIYGWKSGRSAPTIKTAIKIEKLTNGAITVYDWA